MCADDAFHRIDLLQNITPVRQTAWRRHFVIGCLIRATRNFRHRVGRCIGTRRQRPVSTTCSCRQPTCGGVAVEIVTQADRRQQLGILAPDAGLHAAGPLRANLEFQAQIFGAITVNQERRQDGVLPKIDSCPTV